MQAKCINDQSEKYPNFKGELSSYKLAGLTKDKLYQVEQSKQYESYYEVINDLEIKENYKKERFEVMEIKKLTRCYNKECNRNDKNGSCGIKEKYYINNCSSRCIEQLMPIDYEEEYKKLKNLLKTSEDYNKIFSEENERLEKENKALENTRDALVEANNELKEQNELKDSTWIKLEKEFCDSKKENERLKKEKDLIYAQLDNELNRNHVVMEENKELQVMISDQDRSANELREKINAAMQENKNLDIKFDKHLSYIDTLERENEEINKELYQLRDELQQSNFKLKEYETKLPQIQSLVIKLVDINKALAAQIYVEELED